MGKNGHKRHSTQARGVDMNKSTALDSRSLAQAQSLLEANLSNFGPTTVWFALIFKPFFSR